MNDTRLALALTIAVFTSIGGCRCDQQPRDAMDRDGCIAQPVPAPSGNRGPFPFEDCVPKLDVAGTKRPLDQEATVTRRSNDAHACCYSGAESKSSGDSLGK